MPKRQYSTVDDGTPGDDDARYGRPSSSSAESYTYPVTEEIAEELYREVHGRVLNTMQPLYQLPCDEEEIKVCTPVHCPVYATCIDTHISRFLSDRITTTN